MYLRQLCKRWIACTWTKLLYLKPIINGTGNYYLESQTRDERRTDVIVDYLGEQFIVELKIWHGIEYNERGEKQLLCRTSASSLFQLHPILRRRHPLLFLKNPAKIQRIVIPHNIPNLRHIIIGSL